MPQFIGIKRLIKINPGESMKAVILSAGQGTRLLPLTADRPKCLVHVGSRTILEHQVDALHFAGIDDITIVGGYRADRLRAFIEQRWGNAGPKLVLNPFFAVSSSISSVWAARDALAGPFCLMNGDTIFDGGLIADVLAARVDGIGLAVERAEEPQHDDMRVRLSPGGRVLQVQKGLSPLLAQHRSLGLIVAPTAWADYLAALEAVIAGPDGTQSFHHDIIGRMAKNGGVTAIEARGRWGEIDNGDDIATWLKTHEETAGIGEYETNRISVSG